MEILLFNIEKTKAAGIKALCRKLYIGAREIEREDFSRKLAFLAGMSDDDSGRESEEFSEEMLYFLDFVEPMLDITLKKLRQEKLNVSLKAVMTPTNLGFTPYELYRELSAEREAFSKGFTAHQGS